MENIDGGSGCCGCPDKCNFFITNIAIGLCKFREYNQHEEIFVSFSFGFWVLQMFDY
jgi:hypothetical protein